MRNFLQNRSQLVILACFLVAAPIAWKYLSIESIQVYLLRIGYWEAGLLFVLIYIFSIRPFVPIPPTALTVLSGLLFGGLFGGIFSIAGATGNAMLTYWIARSVGFRWLSGKEKLESVLKKIRAAGFQAVFLIRLSPIGPPFDLVSYAAAISGIGFAPYTLGTLVGIIPGTFLFTFLGSTIRQRDILKLLIPIFLISLVFILLPWYLKKRKNK